MELNNALKVDVTKSFSVPADQLYAAWTDGEQLKQWWKPMGDSLKEVTNDIKKGGEIHYVFDGGKLIISGEYLEVDYKQKLVYTWNWELPKDAVKNAAYKLLVEFKSKESGSEIHVVQENFESEENMLPHKHGWEKGLSDLEQFLQQGSEQSNKPQNGSKASEGYREDPDQVKVAGG